MGGFLGSYFDRFKVTIGGQDLAGKPGNIVNVQVSTDAGASWVDGFSEDHMPSGVLLDHYLKYPVNLMQPNNQTPLYMWLLYWY